MKDRISNAPLGALDEGTYVDSQKYQYHMSSPLLHAHVQCVCLRCVCVGGGGSGLPPLLMGDPKTHAKGATKTRV